MRDALRKDSESLDSGMKTFQFEMNGKIYKVCENIINEKFRKYDNVLKEFEKYSAEDALSIQFSHKADLRSLE